MNFVINNVYYLVVGLVGLDSKAGRARSWSERIYGGGGWMVRLDSKARRGHQKVGSRAQSGHSA